METTTSLKAAYEVKVGDVFCERDGFMWRVSDSSFNRGRYTFGVEPVFSSITARGRRTITVKRSASI